MDLVLVKTILGISHNRYDDQISAILPLYIEFAKDYTNNPFTDENGEESLPGAVEISVCKMIEHGMNRAGVKDKYMGDLKFSFDLDFPKPILKLLQPYRRVRF